MIYSFEKIKPVLHPSCFVAPEAIVIGDVQIGAGSSIWFQTVIRGDVNSIRIGEKTNIQDLSMVHVTNRDAPRPAATVIGNEVTIGHRVIVHGCTIGNCVLIGMGAIIMDGAVVGDECIVGAGSLVTENTKIPAGHLVFGTPAKVVRPLSEKEKFLLQFSAESYYQLGQKYLKGIKAWRQNAKMYKGKRK